MRKITATILCSISPKICGVFELLSTPLPSGHSRGILLRMQGISRKKVLRVERQERAAEAEAEFMAGMFQFGMDDWVEEDIFND